MKHWINSRQDVCRCVYLRHRLSKGLIRLSYLCLFLPAVMKLRFWKYVHHGKSLVIRIKVYIRAFKKGCFLIDCIGMWGLHTCSIIQKKNGANSWGKFSFCLSKVMGPRIDVRLHFFSSNALMRRGGCIKGCAVTVAAQQSLEIQDRRRRGKSQRMFNLAQPRLWIPCVSASPPPVQLDTHSNML